MKARPPTGTSHQLQFVVGHEHVIDFADAHMPAVLATPRLIGMLERTAREALSPFLESHERTVGVEIELRHLAATPLGAQVICTARVVSTEGQFVTFHLDAHDDQELIARGLHRRAIIRVDSFARRLAAKTRAQ